MFAMADGHVLVLNCWIQTLKYRIFDGVYIPCFKYQAFHSQNRNSITTVSRKHSPGTKKNCITIKVLSFSLLFLASSFVSSSSIRKVLETSNVT